MNKTVSMRLFKKTFTSNSVKNAYLDACKWYATNIIANEELNGICVKFEKQENSVVIEVFVMLDEQENLRKYCRLCKAINSSYYTQSPLNCDTCKAKNYSATFGRDLEFNAKRIKNIMLNK